jgi:hypothetical protein
MRGTGAEVKVAGCFDSEATCNIMFASADTYDAIEGCHFRSPVYCFDVTGTDSIRPECFARMDACAGHWQVVRDHPKHGEAVGPGCTERLAFGTDQ